MGFTQFHVPKSSPEMDAFFSSPNQWEIFSFLKWRYVKLNVPKMFGHIFLGSSLKFRPEFLGLSIGSASSWPLAASRQLVPVASPKPMGLECWQMKTWINIFNTRLLLCCFSWWCAGCWFLGQHERLKQSCRLKVDSDSIEMPFEAYHLWILRNIVSQTLLECLLTSFDIFWHLLAIYFDRILYDPEINKNDRKLTLQRSLAITRQRSMEIPSFGSP